MSDLEGKSVSHYRIIEKLGAGAMGEVYKAEDTKLGRKVALKFLPEALAQDREALNRFEREARAASALGHPNVCTIYEIGEHDGQPFIAMELVEGQTVAEKLKGGSMQIEQAVAIARQIAEALEEAHEHHIIHRDLKPANVMVSAKGRVKVLDFGLAKLVKPVEPDAPTEKSLLETQIGAVIGTLPYMAPEQLRGEPADARTDLYALGGILYEMTTGLRPFPKTQTASLIAAILTQAPPRPRQLKGPISLELEATILKALAKDRAQRYQSARELLADLGSPGTASEVPLPPPSEPALLPAPPRRTAALTVGIGLVVAVLAGLLFLLIPALQLRLRTPLPVSSGLLSQNQLAVLPFSAIDGGPGDQAFGRGLAETLTAKLTQLSTGRSLQVVPVSDLLAQHVATAKEAERIYRVNLVLSGSLERAGDRVRISYALIDPSSDRQLHAATLTLSGSDPFAIEDRVIEGATQMLGLTVESGERQAVESHGTQMAGAFQDYLQGLGYLENPERVENIDEAIASFRSALKVDPTYALAYAGLGRAYWSKYVATKDTAWVDHAEESCGRAVTLDSKLPASHLCLGVLENGTGQYAKGIVEFQKVLAIEPTNTAAFSGLGHAQFHLKKISDAEATYQRAISIRPNYWAPYNWLGVLYFRIGENEKAAEMFKKVTELAPGNHLAFYNLGAADYLLGKWPEAEAMFKKSIAIHSSASAYSDLGTVLFAEGRYDESAGYFEKAVQFKPKDSELWGNLADSYRWSSSESAKAIPTYLRAAALAREALRVNPSSYELLGELAMYEAQSSNLQQSMRDLRRALSLAPKDFQLMYDAAIVYHLAGQRARTLDYLRRARDLGYPVQAIRAEPYWNDMRRDPAFQKLVQAGKH